MVGGYVRWFTDVPTENAYPYTVLFPVDDQMVIIGHGGDSLYHQLPLHGQYEVLKLELPYR